MLAVAEKFCDRVGILHRGELMAEGEPERLMAEHGETSLEDLFVRLVGSVAQESLQTDLDGLEP